MDELSLSEWADNYNDAKLKHEMPEGEKAERKSQSKLGRMWSRFAPSLSPRARRIRSKMKDRAGKLDKEYKDIRSGRSKVSVDGHEPASLPHLQHRRSAEMRKATAARTVASHKHGEDAAAEHGRADYLDAQAGETSRHYDKIKGVATAKRWRADELKGGSLKRRFARRNEWAVNVGRRLSEGHVPRAIQYQPRRLLAEGSVNRRLMRVA